MANQPFKTVVVEDEPLIRRNLVKKVEASHPHFHVVHEAMNGQEALDFIDSEITDLVITDIKMPEMNGLELAQNLYFAYPHIKMVIVSGHDEFEYAQQAIKYEVEDYLLKPVTKENLTSVLNRIELKLNADMDSLAQMATSLSEGIPPQEIVDTIKSFIKKNYQKRFPCRKSPIN